MFVKSFSQFGDHLFDLAAGLVHILQPARELAFPLQRLVGDGGSGSGSGLGILVRQGRARVHVHVHVGDESRTQPAGRAAVGRRNLGVEMGV